MLQSDRCIKLRKFINSIDSAYNDELQDTYHNETWKAAR
jgi:hypothetical protein